MSYPVYPDTYTHQVTIGDKEVTIEIGRYSQQVSAAVLVTCGETVVHTTVALGRKVNLGYFPLSVEFSEKLYASGIIKGSRWIKRDGRPSDNVILKARVIDRSLRPMFPDGITNEVQVINTVFSYDGQNDPDMLGLLGSAVGLAVSEIPFDGPIAGLRMGYNPETKQFLTNPSELERADSQLDLIVSGTKESIVMVEAGADEVAEDVVVEAMVQAQDHLGKLCGEIDKIVKKVGKDKVELISDEDKATSEELAALVAKLQPKYAKDINSAVLKKGVLQDPELDALQEKLEAELNGDKPEDADDLVPTSMISAVIQKLMKLEARRMILEDKKRPDGRATDEVREIWCEIDVFPRTHGSAMFKRGATQAVTVTTLGTPALGQLIESIEGEETRHYIHHYNMPPYASGEAGRFGFPKRREIGHGALAERALWPMIPDQESFPYTIHVVSEIMSSNGSTSQASVCGSTLSLMAAGVPIKRPVAGIAMGLMSDGKGTFVVLSDIQGLEDHVGDMDFKVAGTENGITAIQMDIKLKGIPRDILEQALEQARQGRMHIMSKMLECIDQPRPNISPFAPKIEQIIIPADRIGELIGPGGKTIKAIIADTEAEVDVTEDTEREVGLVNISSTDQAKIDAARETIEAMMKEVEQGEEYDGRVTRIEDFGAFVEFLPGREGLVHVSNMSSEYVSNPRDLVEMGQEVHIWIHEIKDDGKIGLSMLSPEDQAAAKSNASNKPPFRGGRDGGRGVRNGGRSGGGRDASRGGDRDNSRGSRSYGDNNRGNRRPPRRNDR